MGVQEEVKMGMVKLETIFIIFNMKTEDWFNRNLINFLIVRHRYE